MNACERVHPVARVGGAMNTLRDHGVETLRGTKFEARRAPDALHTLLQRTVRHGGLVVQYPSGAEMNYGDSEDIRLRIGFEDPHDITRTLLADPSLGLCEGYIDGRVSLVNPQDPNGMLPMDQLLKLMRINGVFPEGKVSLWHRVADRLRPPNRQDVRDAGGHYDYGNEYYRLFLAPEPGVDPHDQTMLYSAAFPSDPEHQTLEEAQREKANLILAKWDIQDGEHIAELGSGWGYMLCMAARCNPTITARGITVNPRQVEFARERAKLWGVDDRVTFEVAPYQQWLKDHQGEFDLITAIGFDEHVGRGEEGEHFKLLYDGLKSGGRIFKQVITQAQNRDKPVNGFTDRYVFPGGHLRYAGDFLTAATAAGFTEPQLETFSGANYAWTLRKWYGLHIDNMPEILDLFARGEIVDPNFPDASADGERWFRKQLMYLAGSVAAFEWGDAESSHFMWVKGFHNKETHPNLPTVPFHMRCPRAA